MKTWDGELTVEVKHLKSYDYLPAGCQQMQVICDRIIRLRENKNLEDAPSAVLKHLGELKRPYLTAFEEELLGFIEVKASITKAGESIGDVQDIGIVLESC
ncbi:hypothetical protein [Nostoc sp. CALU 1950]|uniref:hypothetical protein n=1 Tax=Nostoc sp. CALU 1950 TaxID=3104321 RepID=UPI003EBF7D2B